MFMCSTKCLLTFLKRPWGFGCSAQVWPAGGAIARLDQVVGARLRTGERVSISNLNGPRDEPLACAITSNPTSHAVSSPYLIPISSRCRCQRTSTLQNLRKKERRSPCLRSNFPRLVNFDDKPTLCVFAPGVNQSGYCSIFNYYGAVIAHNICPFLQETCRGQTGKESTSPGILCSPK